MENRTLTYFGFMGIMKTERGYPWKRRLETNPILQGQYHDEMSERAEYLLDEYCRNQKPSYVGC